MRYRGQSFELAVPLPPPGGDGEDDLVEAFHAAHEARYGFRLARPVELATLRLRAIGLTTVDARLETQARAQAQAQVQERPTASAPRRFTCIHRGRAFGAEVRLRESLRVGEVIAGPALVVEYSATTFIAPGDRAEVLEGGALLLTVEP
jgi:N-methylhydantoinase A